MCLSSPSSPEAAKSFQQAILPPYLSLGTSKTLCCFCSPSDDGFHLYPQWLESLVISPSVMSCNRSQVKSSASEPLSLGIFLKWFLSSSYFECIPIVLVLSTTIFNGVSSLLQFLPTTLTIYLTSCPCYSDLSKKFSNNVKCEYHTWQIFFCELVLTETADPESMLTPQSMVQEGFETVYCLFPCPNGEYVTGRYWRGRRGKRRKPRLEELVLAGTKYGWKENRSLRDSWWLENGKGK